MLLDRFEVKEQDHWDRAARCVIKLLHKFNGKDLSIFLYTFNKEDTITRAPPELFERIVAILPIQIEKMRPTQLSWTLDTLSKRNLGSDRLYNNFLYFYIEKRTKNLKLEDYIRNLYSLARN